MRSAAARIGTRKVFGVLASWRFFRQSLTDDSTMLSAIEEVSLP
jgi:hypothetical protein